MNTKITAEVKQPSQTQNFKRDELVSKMCKHFELTINQYNNQMLRLGARFLGKLEMPRELMAEGSEFAKLAWRFWAKNYHERDQLVLTLLESPQMQESEFDKNEVRRRMQTLHIDAGELNAKFYAQFGDQILAFFNHQAKAQNATETKAKASTEKSNSTVTKR